MQSVFLLFCVELKFDLRNTKIFIFIFILIVANVFAQNSFTEQDRKILLELNIKMTLLEQRHVELREDMNKRFEQVDKRFEQVEHSIDRVYTVLTILSGIFAAMIAGMFWFYTLRENLNWKLLSN
ncbi:MAG: hypothetical protein SFY32_14985 [Bacteroidota bacterium]|nr:hypothetical protein [Bacteroidota bacterium]